MSRSASERGLFNSTCYRTIRDRETRQGNDEEKFGLHDSELGRRMVDYSSVDPANGLVRPGSFVGKGDVLVSKSLVQKQDGRTTQRDNSCSSKHDERAQVTRVLLFSNKENLNEVCIQTAARRRPKLGDKFSSRHGQKGVIGMVYSQEEMLYNAETGAAAELIINPHAIPSRMTLGHLLEMLAGDAACQQGFIINGTPFRGIQARDLDLLTVQKTMGKAIYCDPATGDMLRDADGRPQPVYAGTIYYQRLKHVVRGARRPFSRGPSQPTRQASRPRPRGPETESPTASRAGAACTACTKRQLHPTPWNCDYDFVGCCWNCDSDFIRCFFPKSFQSKTPEKDAPGPLRHSERARAVCFALPLFLLRPRGARARAVVPDARSAHAGDALPPLCVAGLSVYAGVCFCQPGAVVLPGIWRGRAAGRVRARGRSAHSSIIRIGIPGLETRRSTASACVAAGVGVAGLAGVGAA
jgi:hypothetical protein